MSLLWWLLQRLLGAFASVTWICDAAVSQTAAPNAVTFRGTSGPGQEFSRMSRALNGLSTRPARLRKARHAWPRTRRLSTDNWVNTLNMMIDGTLLQFQEEVKDHPYDRSMDQHGCCNLIYHLLTCLRFIPNHATLEYLEGYLTRMPLSKGLTGAGSHQGVSPTRVTWRSPR